MSASALPDNGHDATPIYPRPGTPEFERARRKFEARAPIPAPVTTEYNGTPEANGLIRDRDNGASVWNGNGWTQATQPADSVKREQEEREKQTPHLLPLTWASSLAADEVYEPQLVAGLFERKGKALVFGASSSGKTTFITDIACRIAAGVPWIGRQVLRGLVCIVAAESPTGTLRRMRAFIRQHNADPSKLHLAVFIRPLTFDLAAIDQLVSTMKAHSEDRKLPVRLVVIDTLAANEGGKEDSEHFARVDRAQAQIRDALDCLAIVVHHSGKVAEAGARAQPRQAREPRPGSAAVPLGGAAPG